MIWECGYSHRGRNAEIFINWRKKKGEGVLYCKVFTLTSFCPVTRENVSALHFTAAFKHIRTHTHSGVHRHFEAVELKWKKRSPCAARWTADWEIYYRNITLPCNTYVITVSRNCTCIYSNILLDGIQVQVRHNCACIMRILLNICIGLHMFINIQQVVCCQMTVQFKWGTTEHWELRLQCHVVHPLLSMQ